MASDLNLSLILKAKDSLSGVVRSAVTKSDKDFESLRNKIAGVGDELDKIGKRSVVAGAALLGVSAVNLKTAADFETGMTNVSTLIDTNVENLDEMNKKVLEIGKNTPVALNDLTSALYDIRSAGVGADEQFKVLEKSAQLGVAGLGSTSQAVDLVTSSLNAFGLEGAEADRVYDNIFKTVKYGKTTIAGIAQGFGSVAGTVAAAEIKLDDYLASVTALTTTGQPAAVAHTQIKAAISGMTRESEESRKVLNALGAKSFKDLIQKSGGMVNAFSAIVKQVDGNDAAILQLFGSTEAYNSVVGLTTKQHEKYTEALNAMRNAPPLVDEAYQKQLKTLNSQLQRCTNFIQSVSIQFGNAIAPAFSVFLDAAEKVVGVIDKMPDGLKSAIALSTLFAGVGLVAFGTLAIGAGAAVRGFGDILEAYRKIDIWLWAHPLKMPKFDIGTPKANLNVIKTAVLDMVLSTKVKLQVWAITVSNSIRTSMASMSASYAAASNKFLWGTRGIVKGLQGVVKSIFNVIKAQAVMGASLLTNPIGWIGLAIAGTAILIMKYWEPIKAFFGGVWAGIIEGTKPLQPMFKGISNAVAPLVEWFKNLITPVKAVDDTAKNLGVTIGKTIGSAIVGLTNLAKTVFDVIKWLNPLYWLFKGGKWAINATKENKKNVVGIKTEAAGKTKVDGKHEKGLSYVPRNGYIAELHQGERVLTKEENRNYSKNSQSVILQYSPSIEILGELKEAPEWLKRLLKEHTKEILRMLDEYKRRQEARSYA